jgi:L-seryl-tRNA(Ser) seleniumtransferase
MATPRLIPSIDALRQRPGIKTLETTFGTRATLQVLQEEAAALRTALLDASHASGAADVATAEEVAARIERGAMTRLNASLRTRLRAVINATGVLIHTNLGRAPLCDAALARVRDVARGFASLELELETGRRGRRDVHAEAQLTNLTGAEAALVVNNNAAATLLVLAALANGREVVISRGELVEIGGGFRVPDVLKQSGAILREVGTTNRTRAADYAAAISDKTALILRVHPSNFSIEGFTARATLEELVEIAHGQGIPLVEDLGSGWLESTPVRLDEPSIEASIRAGADLVTFSGDKLLGGPQAGIIVGTRELVELIRSHPLMRALRVDKMTYAALEATLVEHARGIAADTVPVLLMLSQSFEVLSRRAEAFARQLAQAGFDTRTATGHSAVGGGSAPATRLPTRLVSIEIPGMRADALLARLRELDPPVIARIEEDRVVLDLRTVPMEQEEALAAAMATVMEAFGEGRSTK